MATFQVIVHARYVRVWYSIEDRDYGARYAEWSDVTLFVSEVEADYVAQAHEAVRFPLFAMGWDELDIDTPQERITRPRFVPLAA